MKQNEVIIDFETYYDKELSVDTMGVVNYARKSDAYIVSIVRGDDVWCGEIGRLYGDGPDSCPRHLRPDPEKDTPIAANANFDQEFWNKYFPRFKEHWRCVLDRAAGRQLPRNMMALSKVVLNRTIDKSIRSALSGKKWNEMTDEEKKITKDYCADDGRAERDCYNAIEPLTEIEDKISAHTRMTNRRGVRIDEEEVRKAKNTLENAKHAAFLKIPWQEYAKPLSYDHFCQYCLKNNVKPPLSLDKRDGVCSTWLKENPGVGKALLAMRAYRQANTMSEKLDSLLSRLVQGILPMEMLYCGAPHTRRWSSRGFNIQNLERDGVVLEVPGIDKKDTTIFTRKFLVPREGKSFVILDLAQIEPRCLAWWVEDYGFLEAVRKGYAVYEAYARKNMGWVGGELKKENKPLYNLAKASVLGAGYGCGAAKFKNYAETVLGLEYTDDESLKIVKDYRKANPGVTRLWRRFDQLIFQTVREGAPRLLEIEMPTGDCLLRYQVSPQEDGYTSMTVKGDIKSLQPKLWGGVLTENVIQRMARDVLAENLITIEEAGIPVIFSCHDELVMEIDTEDAPEALKFATEVMRTPPEWAPDLPLDVEGGIFDHYTKG